MPLAMNWEERLREMILAGGALAAAGCGGPTAAQADASANTRPNERFTSGDDGSSNDAPFTGGPNNNAAGGCCNGDPDPCCFLGCSPATEASQKDCEESEAQCEAMNGLYELQPNGSLGCILDAGSAGCDQSLAAFCAQAATGRTSMDMPCDSTLSQAQANLVRTKSACMGIEDFFPELTRGCNGYDVLLEGAIETGTGEYFDPTTGNLVAIVTFNNWMLPIARCIAGPADFVVPQCSASAWIDPCADAASSGEGGDATGDAAAETGADAATDAGDANAE